MNETDVGCQWNNGPRQWQESEDLAIVYHMDLPIVNLCQWGKGVANQKFHRVLAETFSLKLLKNDIAFQWSK